MLVSDTAVYILPSTPIYTETYMFCGTGHDCDGLCQKIAILPGVFSVAKGSAAVGASSAPDLGEEMGGGLK